MQRFGVFCVATLATLAAPAFALAHETSAGGGVSVRSPVANEFLCDDGRVSSCGRRQSLTVRGEWLDGAKSVTFLGRKGSRDDRNAKVVSNDSHSVVVRIPSAASSGPVRVVASAGNSKARRVRVTQPSATSQVGADTFFIDGPEPVRFDYVAAPGTTIELVRMGDLSVARSWPVPSDSPGQGSISWDGRLVGKDAPVGRYGFRVVPDGSAPGAVAKQFSLFDHIFPIRGKHDLGQGPVNNFGGGRGHQGQDMFAACGTRLAAARGGVVVKSTYQSRAGNYVVIRRADGQSYAYMHMRKRSPLREGERVVTGQTVGEVGETGRASGCHLHFELWTAPGWYSGGKPIDPLPALTLWDNWS